MAKSLFQRVPINEFIETLTELTFDEVTIDKLQEMLPHADVQDVSDELEITHEKTISIDDFVFTIYRVSNEVVPEFKSENPYILNDSICIDKDVVVWVMEFSDVDDDTEIELNGVLKYDGNYYMTVECDIV